MKMFIVTVEDWMYDCIESVAVLSESKERAIELAIKFDKMFENNIGDIEEIDLEHEGIVHSHVIYG